MGSVSPGRTGSHKKTSHTHPNIQRQRKSTDAAGVAPTRWGGANRTRASTNPISDQETPNADRRNLSASTPSAGRLLQPRRPSSPDHQASRIGLPELPPELMNQSEWNEPPTTTRFRSERLGWFCPVSIWCRSANDAVSQRLAKEQGSSKPDGRACMT